MPAIINVTFLSRLFGGEVTDGSFTATVDFLSRLFGGEAELVMLMSALVFLSRLFGGEALARNRIRYSVFLSRLFGGEVEKISIKYLIVKELCIFWMKIPFFKQEMPSPYL
jgi:hypothetical protein